MTFASMLRGRVGAAISDAVSWWVRRHTAPTPIDLIAKSNAGCTLTVASYFARANGISSGANLQVAALRALGLKTRPVDATPAIRRPFASWDDDDIGAAASPVVIVHSDGRMASIPLHYMRKHVARAIRIGYCAWELPDPPRAWGEFAAPFSEIWVPSTFCKLALGGASCRPVRVVRHVVRSVPHECGTEVRRQLGIQEGDTVVLAMVDLRSSLARKNPLGAVMAFKKALGHRSDCTLVLKVSGAKHDVAAYSLIREGVKGARVVVVDKYLDESEKWGLYQAADIFVSLHRSEGYGLPLAEAMHAGKAVIGTGWSGNLDYMNFNNSALIDFELVDVRDPQGVYRGGQWAEPCLDHAIAWLSKLYMQPHLRVALGERAKMSMSVSAQLSDFSSQLPDWFVRMAPGRVAA